MVRISEARLNDLVYMTLKKTFFVPLYGSSPRECDVRVCMDMICRERLTMESGILRPDEVSPRSHEVFYNVDLEKIPQECFEYLEDHWIKDTYDNAAGTEGAKSTAIKWLLSELYPVLMATPEEDCGE